MMSAKKTSYLQRKIPSELLQIILSYYTNCLSGLLCFRTICKQFYQAVEVSLLWLTAELIFQAPKDFIPNDIPEFLPPVANNIQMFRPFHYSATTSKIVLLQPEYVRFHRYEINYSNEIEKIKEFTFKVVRKYNELWQWRIKWFQIFSKINSCFLYLTTDQMGFLIHFFAFLGSVFSIFLIVDTPNYSNGTSQTWNGQVGFSLLYFVGISLTIYILHLLITKIHHLIQFPPSHDLELSIITIENIMYPLIYLLVDVGIFFTIILTQWKFSSSSASSFPYVFITLPLWIFWGIAFSLIVSHWSYFEKPISRLLFAGNSLYLMLSVPLTISYCCLYYDLQLASSSFRLFYGLFPLFPLQIGAIYWLIMQIKDCYYLGLKRWKEIQSTASAATRSKSKSKVTFTKLIRFHEILQLLCRLMSVGFMIYLDLLILAADDRRYRHRSYVFSLIRVHRGSLGEVLQCLVCLLVEYQLSYFLRRMNP